mmetsp:Transcript_41097/g.110402  ORF Transcript_41097/g.110402 Transcript_41097/m.110402 type:complete len:330 (+) Transcript_41097:1005-1994(+)
MEGDPVHGLQHGHDVLERCGGDAPPEAHGHEVAELALQLYLAAPGHHHAHQECLHLENAAPVGHGPKTLVVQGGVQPRRRHLPPLPLEAVQDQERGQHGVKARVQEVLPPAAGQETQADDPRQQPALPAEHVPRVAGEREDEVVQDGVFYVHRVVERLLDVELRERLLPNHGIEGQRLGLNGVREQVVVGVIPDPRQPHPHEQLSRVELVVEGARGRFVPGDPALELPQGAGAPAHHRVVAVDLRRDLLQRPGVHGAGTGALRHALGHLPVNIFVAALAVLLVARQVRAPEVVGKPELQPPVDFLVERHVTHAHLHEPEGVRLLVGDRQ